MATDLPPIDNNSAVTLKSLHKPGDPIIFTNIYDVPSTTTVISLNETNFPPIVKAIATASYAIATTFSVPDADLTLDQNLTALKSFSHLARSAGLPLSVDLQDGYGELIKSAVKSMITYGAVGANIEDSYPEKGFGDGMNCLRSLDESVERIKIALSVAREVGLPDFVINARTDVLRLKPNPEGWTREMMLEEAVKRGKAFLDAGATCVFVWGGAAGVITREEVKKLVKEFQGRLAVKLADDKTGLSVKELAELGVCRTSVGPSLYSKDIAALKRKAERILKGGQLWAEADL
jgi:2-methylisocitrate lyase-like PEP mutase family enzyme